MQPAQLSRMVGVPGAKVLNGVTRLAPNDKASILAADSSAGMIYKIDVSTGVATIALQHPTMASLPGGPRVGVNGIHTLADYLYYTSLDQMIFARIPISLLNGTATGSIDVISNGTLRAADDFVLSQDATRAWIAENGRNVITDVDIISKIARVTANSTLLTSISSVALGQACGERRVLH